MVLENIISSLRGGDETDAKRANQNEAVVNNSLKEHSSKTESNSRHTKSKVVDVLDSFSEPPANHIVCLGRCCFYLDLTDVNTETKFDFVEQTTSSQDINWRWHESIVKQNSLVNTDELTVVIATGT